MESCKLTLVFFTSIITIANAENGATFLIYGGTPAKDGQFPFQGILKLNDAFQCGAIVLNENFVLTAAHCLREGKPKDYTVHFGVLNQEDTKNATLRKVIEMVLHEKYDDNTVDNDIGLLKLEKPLQYSNVIQPVELPNPEEDFNGQLVTVSGWGKTESWSGSEELLFTDLRIMNREVCKELATLLKPLFGSAEVTEGKVCAVSHDEEIHSACCGDSGGPLVLKDSSTLVGIVSHGIYDLKHYDVCGAAINVYVNVSHYIEWIETHM